MMNKKIIDLCPIKTTQNILAGKWKIVLMWELSEGTKRFNELLRLNAPISQTMLTSQLRELERDGLVQRKIFSEIPPKVEYSLTPIGISFIPVLKVMKEWGINYEALRNNGL